MEVYDPHSNGKKKWSEHLFEFLLLFLAVFAGFVSENIRETIVEKHRSKQYVEFLIRDLKTDTSNLNSSCLNNDTLMNLLDSLIIELKAYHKRMNLDTLYYYLRLSTEFFTFTHASRAIDQLENSGQLRLIDNVKLSDSIAAYYTNIKDLEDYGRLYQDGTLLMDPIQL